MAECKKCSEEIPPNADICPKCGTLPGTTETITDVTRPRSHSGHKERRASRAERREERKAERKRKCVGCGKEIDEFMETCPYCGTGGGAAETITDFIDES